MGMYTRLSINVHLKPSTPPDVIEGIEFLASNQNDLVVPPAFTQCKKAECMFWRGQSWIGCQAPRFEEDPNQNNSWSLSAACELKNYDNKIETFLAFIEPWISPAEIEFLGWHQYEEHNGPTLIYNIGGKIKQIRIEIEDFPIGGDPVPTLLNN